jgi:hypothetical protein
MKPEMSMHFIEAAGWTSGFNENKGRIMMVLPSKESTTTSKSKRYFCWQSLPGACRVVGFLSV